MSGIKTIGTFLYDSACLLGLTVFLIIMFFRYKLFQCVQALLTLPLEHLLKNMIKQKYTPVTLTKIVICTIFCSSKI